jgi:hypothetical protein
MIKITDLNQDIHGARIMGGDKFLELGIAFKRGYDSAAQVAAVSKRMGPLRPSGSEDFPPYMPRDPYEPSLNQSSPSHSAPTGGGGGGGGTPKWLSAHQL